MTFEGVMTRGGSSRLQREGPKPANADVIQAHQVYIVGHNNKVRFRKGGQTAFCPPRSEFGPVAPLDPPVVMTPMITQDMTLVPTHFTGDTSPDKVGENCVTHRGTG